jgi:hypothetical protein
MAVVAVSQPHRAANLKARRFMEAQGVSRRRLQVWPASMQVESLCQHIKRVAHYLLRVLAELPIKIRIVVRADAALECFGIDRSVKEPRRYKQRANPIASVPSSADFDRSCNSGGRP